MTLSLSERKEGSSCPTKGHRSLLGANCVLWPLRGAHHKRLTQTYLDQPVRATCNDREQLRRKLNPHWVSGETSQESPGPSTAISPVIPPSLSPPDPHAKQPKVSSFSSVYTLRTPHATLPESRVCFCGPSLSSHPKSLSFQISLLQSSSAAKPHLKRHMRIFQLPARWLPSSVKDIVSLFLSPLNLSCASLYVPMTQKRPKHLNSAVSRKVKHLLSH